MPFFRSTTSLLQLLLDLDFDTVKPDLIVMRLARRLGIVGREEGDRAFRECARFLQTYSIGESCRASELDLALLAFGGQTGASRLLTQRFCPAIRPLPSSRLPLGRKWFMHGAQSCLREDAMKCMRPLIITTCTGETSATPKNSLPAV